MDDVPIIDDMTVLTTLTFIVARHFGKFLQKNDEMHAAGIMPEAVAALVEGILNNPDPKTLYTVGRFKQHFIAAEALSAATYV
jgi:hypothetical protein